MSTLSETIQYAQLATSGCQEIGGVLGRADELLSDMERALRSAFDGTGHIGDLSASHRSVSNSLTDTRQAVQLLHEQLTGLVAQFHQAV